MEVPPCANACSTRATHKFIYISIHIYIYEVCMYSSGDKHFPRSIYMQKHTAGYARVPARRTSRPLRGRKVRVAGEGVSHQNSSGLMKQKANDKLKSRPFTVQQCITHQGRVCFPPPTLCFLLSLCRLGFRREVTHTEAFVWRFLHDALRNVHVHVTSCA